MDIFEDIDDIVEAINRARPDQFNIWEDREFLRGFRLSKDKVLHLLNEIEHRLLHRTQRNNAVSPLNQLLLTLRFCATGSFYITLLDFGGIHKSTAAKILPRVINAIVDLRPQYIFQPQTNNEMKDTMRKIYQISRFPRVLGALDCTHIRLQSQGGPKAEIFRNRKGYFSLNVVRWRGSAHDSHIFDNSAVIMNFETGQFGNSKLLGDGGYPVRSYLLTPINNPNNQAENLYKESQIRNVIERMFGVWKRCFPILSNDLRCQIILAQRFVVACAVLHNIACEGNEIIPDDVPEIEDENQENNYVNEGGNNAERHDVIDYFATMM